MNTDDWHSITVRIPLASAHHADIARQVLQVDPELQPHAVHRTLDTEGDELVATFKCSTIRLTRLSINSFLENIDLVARTLGEFGEEAEAEAEAAAAESESTTASVPAQERTGPAPSQAPSVVSATS